MKQLGPKPVSPIERRILDYVSKLKNWKNYYNIEPVGKISPNNWTRILGTNRSDDNKFTYMPLSAQVRHAAIDKVYTVDHNKKFLGNVQALKFEYHIQPYNIFKYIHRRDGWDSSRGLSIAMSRYKLLSLRKQFEKTMSIMGKLMEQRKQCTEGRAVYREFELDVLKECSKVKPKTGFERMRSYGKDADRKTSSFVSGYKWGQINDAEYSLIVPNLIEYCGHLHDYVKDVPDEMVPVISTDFGFGGMRTRSEIAPDSQMDGKMTEILAETRDVISLGPNSHWWALLDEDWVKTRERQLIEKLGIVNNQKIYSPFVSNPEMWRWLDKRMGMGNMDGSNWQAQVGVLLSPLTATINIGWQLLASGATTTSVAGISAMSCKTAVVYPEVDEFASFGDDVAYNLPVAEIPNEIESGPTNVFLGYDYVNHYARGCKVAMDRSDKAIGSKNLDRIFYRVNTPDNTTMVSLCVVYGLCPVVDPIELNKKMDKYVRPGDISAEHIQQNKWTEVIDWFNTRGASFFQW